MDRDTCLRKAGDRSLNEEAISTKEWTKGNAHHGQKKISEEDGRLKTPEGDAQPGITRGRFSTLPNLGHTEWKGGGSQEVGFSFLILSHEAPLLVHSHTGAPLTLPVEN